MVAVDAVCRAIMSLEPRGLLHVRLAAERGLDPCDLKQIEVRGVPVEEASLARG